uniref:Peptidase S1 domain-containing protein n=1 Tax=Anopheles christyi TaxID=43041 RepID=A0A182KAZ4_9DIPT
MATSACNCVPENDCPAPDVDLRLIDDDDQVCSTGMVCCDLPAAKLDETFCAGGVCVSDRSECSGEEYDEYGTDQIDIRTNDDDDDDARCPGTQYCCRKKPEKDAPLCDGTCLPMSLCTMFEPGPGCTDGNVCCRMDRNWWMDMINDINGMEESNPTNKHQRGCKWSRLRSDDTTIVPPWLVSIWAQVEIVPGIQTDQFVCGGVLVDPLLVMTAASCVKDLPAQQMFANVGDYDISSRSLIRAENIHTVKEKIIHEYYNTSDPVHNDVALLRLTNPIRNGKCNAPLATPPANACKARNIDCYTIGWNRTLLAAGFGRPKRYPVQVTTFQEDMFCAPGTICIDRDGGGQCYDADESLHGSVIVCEEGELQEDWKVRGLLMRNCTGVAIESVAAWLDHQRNPGFVQKPRPMDPSRQYLPVV